MKAIPERLKEALAREFTKKNKSKKDLSDSNGLYECVIVVKTIK
jgi:hypothetical protein